jgi:hypothetical protein
MAAGTAYRRSVVVALALAGAVLFIVAGLGTAARRVRIGALDAQALAEKLAVPHPVSALDWPELRVRAVVPQPARPLVVVLLAGRPGFDEQASTLLVRLDGDGTPVALLSRWCADGASVAPRRLGGLAAGGREFELRRRQSLERVSGSVLTEDATPLPLASRRGPDGQGRRPRC